jgi:hypothetical protein
MELDITELGGALRKFSSTGIKTKSGLIKSHHTYHPGTLHGHSVPSGYGKKEIKKFNKDIWETDELRNMRHKMWKKTRWVETLCNYNSLSACSTCL